MIHLRHNVYEHNGYKLCAVSGKSCRECPVSVSCDTQFVCGKMIGYTRVFIPYAKECDEMYLNFKCVVPTAKDLGDMILAMTKRNLLESKPEGDSWQYSHFAGLEGVRFLQTSEPALFCGWSMELTTFTAAMALIMQIPEVIKLQPKFSFRPNAPVLVRDASCYWTPARYAYMLNERFVVFGGNSYTQLLQYEPNRQLIGRCITPDSWWEIEDFNKPVWKTKR